MTGAGSPTRTRCAASASAAAARGDDPLLAFVAAIGLLSEDRKTLSERGQAYFNASFIRGDAAASDAVLHGCVMDHPPATAVTQLLAGVPGADRGRVETVLRSQGFGGVTDRAVGSLLKLMHRAGLVDYNTRTSSVVVLDSPVTAAADRVPPSVYVSPTTPFGNKVWLRRVLAECTGSIDWLDKHFMPVAFEPLWEAVDGARVSRVRILSLRLAEHDGKRPLRQYRDLRSELAGRSVDLSWRTIDSTKIRDTHDRWVIGADTARNVPNVNAIYTGQHSEMHASPQREDLVACTTATGRTPCPSTRRRRPPPGSPPRVSATRSAAGPASTARRAGAALGHHDGLEQRLHDRAREHPGAERVHQLAHLARGRCQPCRAPPRRGRGAGQVLRPAAPDAAGGVRACELSGPRLSGRYDA